MFEDHQQFNFNLLFRLRTIVCRFGEMDGAHWWNTKGVLAKDGAFVLGRGFPSTHYIVQARIGTAVARARSREVFMHPNCYTLWDLPPEVEDRYDAFLQDIGRKIDEWGEFFGRLQPPPSIDLLGIMESYDVDLSQYRGDIEKLRRSAENRAVLLPDSFTADDRTITLLAAAFSKGELGQPAIPYIHAEEGR
jgi:hypothetical protein